MVNKFYDLRGGTERVMFDLSAALTQAGHEVVPFATQDPRNEATPFERYFVAPRRYDGGGLVARAKLAAAAIHDHDAARALGRLLDDHPCDVAHLHNIYHQLSPSILGELRRRGIPTLMTLHDYKIACPNYKLYRDGEICEKCVTTKTPLWPFLHACHRDSRAESILVAVESTLHRLTGAYEKGVDLFVSPSEFLAEILRRRLPSARLQVIRNSAGNASAADAGKRATRPTVLYAGRLSAEKGVDLLLASAADAKEVEIRVAGSGPLEESLRERFHGENIVFLGRLEAGELERERAAAWAIAIPSQWYENAPLSLLEAYASARPVLAAAHGGLLEMVEHEASGWLIEPAAVDAWSSALRRVAASPDALTQMGERGYELARNRYSFDTFLASYLGAYEKLLSARV
jgi:glycosyltransferase involved in cell wall biosynthesis